MPELTTQGIDVTREEQRYLRRTFRRMAWPYVVGLMAFCWWVASSGNGGPDPSEELAAQRAEVAELARVVESLSQGLDKADQRAAELAGSLEEGRSGDLPGEVAALKRDLKRAAGRIASLEKKLGASLQQRFDALADRIASVEGQANRSAVPASPAPSPPSPVSPDSP